MKALKTKPAIAFIALAFFALTMVVGPSTAHAAWDDRSDELPGMSSGTVILVGGLVAAGLITVMLLKKGGKDTADEGTTDEQPAGEPESDDGTDASASRSVGGSFHSAISAPSTPKSDFGLYYGCDLGHDQSGKLPDLSDLRVKVGVSLSF